MGMEHKATLLCVLVVFSSLDVVLAQRTTARTTVRTTTRTTTRATTRATTTTTRPTTTTTKATTTLPPTTTAGFILGIPNHICNLNRTVNITGDLGTISSPNYPRLYGYNQRCTWRIQLNDTRKTIQLSAITFNTELIYDKVFIRPLTNGQELIGPITGLIFLTRCIADHSVEITFSSDDSFNRTGFLIKFEAIEREDSKPAEQGPSSVTPVAPSTFTCNPNGTRNVMADSGLIVSPNYPGLYPNSQNCTWSVQVSAGKGIKFSSIRLDLEGQLGQCKDVLMVKTTLFQSNPYCGDLPFSISVNSSSASVYFSSNGSNQRTGFSLMFEAV